MAKLRSKLWMLAAGCGWGLSGGPSPAPRAADPAPRVDFRRDVQPILKAHCHACHGETMQESELRLDDKTAALAGGVSGPVIVAGKPDESLLIELVSGDDPDRLMPPKDDPLTAEQIETLKRWIKAGAEWPEGDDDSAGR